MRGFILGIVVVVVVKWYCCVIVIVIFWRDVERYGSIPGSLCERVLCAIPCVCGCGYGCAECSVSDRGGGCFDTKMFECSSIVLSGPNFVCDCVVVICCSILTF